MTTLSQDEFAVGPPAGRRATMRDVAALAGVGIKTVSRVVNGEPGVSPALTERVTTAAAQLDFQPDMTAGNLRRSVRRSRSLGLLLASVDNPFCSAIHRAVEDVAEQRGVAVLTASTDEQPERERALVAAFTSRRVDGLIVSPTAGGQAHLVPELRAGTPIVMVDRPPVGIDVDTVLVDNAAGAAGATAHLLGGGHRRIAYLGDLSTIATARYRREGYHRAMAEAGVPVDGRWVVDDLHDAEVAYEAAYRMLSEEDAPTALFTSQNLVTIGAIRALRALGLHQDVAVVGFDDFPLADLLEPAVTVVAQDPAAMGRAAAERVFARLDGDTQQPQHLTVPTRLVQRGSGEIPVRTDRAPGRAGLKR